MANYTVSEQRRRAVLIEGVEKFEVYIEIIDPGDLPTRGLFVLEINDATDPKEDEFARVATVADLVDLVEDRDLTIDKDEELYRVTSYKFYYDNIDTAVAAQSVLKDRLDELTQDWATYQEQFETVSETTNHPRYDSDTFNTLVSAYEDALEAEETAKTTRDDAKDDYDTASTDATDAATDLADAKSRRDKCYELKAYFQALYDAMKSGTGFYQDAETFRAAADTYKTATTGTDPAAETIYNNARDTFVSKQRDANTALTTAAANLATFATECSNKDTAVTTAETAKTTADTALSQARTAYEDAQSAYAAAQTASDAALTAIKTLKPDYDPTTASSSSSSSSS